MVSHFFSDKNQNPYMSRMFWVIAKSDTLRPDSGNNLEMKWTGFNGEMKGKEMSQLLPDSELNNCVTRSLFTHTRESEGRI